MSYRTIRVAPRPAGESPAPELPGDLTLTAEEIRVLGSLVEKAITTPEYYPMTVNALVAACNQKTSRDPIVDYDEQTVMQALESLQHRDLVHVITRSEGGRVARYRHLFFEGFRLNQPQGAALCVLLLRGAQTLGEIRQRSARLYDFASLQEVQDTLDELANREAGRLVVRLAREIGTKEARYMHVLERGVAAEDEPDEPTPAAEPSEAHSRKASMAVDDQWERRVEFLEREVEQLRAELEEVRSSFEAFRKQFES